MRKFVLIEYDYKGIKGRVVILNRLPAGKIKKICLRDAVRKESVDEVKILRKEEFNYERI